jgi:alkanesulfonate monooxygenase
MALRFHWRLPLAGEGMALPRSGCQAGVGVPDLSVQVPFCRLAEECGIDSVLVDFGATRPDPLVLTAALGLATRRLNFIVAHRSGLQMPAGLVQQLNTLAALLDGRVALNLVAGSSPREQRGYGDFLGHDARYARARELLEVCRAFWKGEVVDYQGNYYQVEGGALGAFPARGTSGPEILVAGNSTAARELAIDCGSSWARFADRPERLAPLLGPVLEHGKEVALRLSVVVRPTHHEAVQAAQATLAGLDRKAALATETRFVGESDSVAIQEVAALAQTEWLAPGLWAGAVPVLGAAALALVGTPEEVAAAILRYADIGVGQFILSGWPKREAMIAFCREVLPLVRRGERDVGGARQEGGA